MKLWKWHSIVLKIAVLLWILSRVHYIHSPNNSSPNALIYIICGKTATSNDGLPYNKNQNGCLTLELKTESSFYRLSPLPPPPQPTFGIAFFWMFCFPVRDSARFPDLGSQGLGRLLCNFMNHHEQDLLGNLPLFAFDSACPLAWVGIMKICQEQGS